MTSSRMLIKKTNSPEHSMDTRMESELNGIIALDISYSSWYRTSGIIISVPEYDAGLLWITFVVILKGCT